MTLLLFACGLLLLLSGGLFLLMPSQLEDQTLTVAPGLGPRAKAQSTNGIWSWLIGVALIGVGTFLMMIGAT